MNAYEPIGYLASLLVLATFSMRDMVSLRVVAIASNIAFIAYGALAEISPVLLLHVVLLPVNLLRLVESVRSMLRGRAEAASFALGHRPCSAPPLTDDAEPVVAAPLLCRVPSPPRPLRRSTKAATLQ
ncbi:MAG: hypothetical protein ACXW13_12325 [Burkholderiaceae bacterium]